MKNRFIDRFDVILLDMGRTFMFGVDRFSDSEDYGATYRRIGGRVLSSRTVSGVISRLFDKMLRDSRNPDFYDRFAPVLSYLRAIPELKDLAESELGLLERVFALHEIGTISSTHAEVLRRLRETHRLGIVSNIWSKADLFLKELERAKVRSLFDVIVFSSRYGRIKPSPYLFTKAIEAFDAPRSKIVFVGDSLKRDVAGAKRVSLSAVWIRRDTSEFDQNLPGPDLVVRDLRDLLEGNV